jgi:hypothetical protein
MADDKGTAHFYISGDKDRVRASFWPADSSLHLSINLAPADALRLAKHLTEAVASLPRVAEASDLGLVA